jgi:hypothetical protein
MPLSKTTQNAPWWWKRLESALIFFFTSLIPLIGLSKTLPANITHDLTLIYLPGASMLIKSIGIFLMGIPAEVIEENETVPVENK